MLRPFIEGVVIQSVVDRVSFYCSSYYVQLVSQKVDVLDFLVKFDWEVLSPRGEGTELVSEDHVFAGLYSITKSYFCI